MRGVLSIRKRKTMRSRFRTRPREHSSSPSATAAPVHGRHARAYRKPFPGFCSGACARRPQMTTPRAAGTAAATAPPPSRGATPRLDLGKSPSSAGRRCLEFGKTQGFCFPRRQALWSDGGCPRRPPNRPAATAAPPSPSIRAAPVSKWSFIPGRRRSRRHSQGGCRLRIIRPSPSWLPSVQSLRDGAVPKNRTFANARPHRTAVSGPVQAIVRRFVSLF